MKKEIARLADRKEDYEKLGLDPTKIFQWEDGLRTTGKLGEYEWWYFDAKLEGGYSLVIIFYSQPVTAATNGIAPCVSFSLSGGGYEILEETRALPKDSFFSRKKCDIRIGKSFIQGNLRNYKIQMEPQPFGD